jgi:hypothetical protein
MILYIIGIVIFFIILFLLYIRLKYKFWSLQPVFHFYDFYYWFVNVGVIRHELPEKNRYTNFKKIITTNFEDIKEHTLKQIITLIQLNYLRNNENTFIPKKENIVPYFMCHNIPTYWSYYLEPEMLIDNKTGSIVEETKIIGAIACRPLHVIIISMKKNTNFDVYYIDYLCVNKNWRNKNIAPELIQTHEYNQSYKNRNICVSLFKREEELTGIIPLTIYKTYCFNMNNWSSPVLLNPRITLLTGDKQNMYYLYDFINRITKNELKQRWDILIYPEISNIIELVSTKNLFVKMLVVNGDIVSFYIFRKTCTFIESEKEIISCIASVNGNILTKEEFIQGFKVALWSIIKTHKNFKYLTIENISDNMCIIDNICIRTHPMVVSPMAYFFYNFAYSPFKSEKCLIIN